MKLLFDENLSDRLTRTLSADFPDSLHVRQVGLKARDDQEVWDFAKLEGLTIVSKDSDFHQRSLLYGPPPKVIWLQIGNCTTDEIADLLRGYSEAIADFQRDPHAAFLILA